MPNIGKPSQGCHGCRQRRVKVSSWVSQNRSGNCVGGSNRVQCDQARPRCNRCTVTGRVCPGYRDELEVNFKVEDVEAYKSNIGRDRRKTQLLNTVARPPASEYIRQSRWREEMSIRDTLRPAFLTSTHPPCDADTPHMW